MNSRLFSSLDDEESKGDGFRLDRTLDLRSGDVVEVPLLLSGDQLSALEQAAALRGLSTGAMVRTLLHDFISDLEPAPPF